MHDQKALPPQKPREPSPENSGSAFAPLLYPDFRNIWVAFMLSRFAMFVQIVGASWLMTTISQTADMVGLVYTANSVPIVFLSLIAGALADSFDRRLIMILAQLFIVASAGLLLAVTLAGWITPWLLLGMVALAASGSGLNSPAWQASVGDIVRHEDIPSAVMLNSVALNLARAVGPALGGILVATWGPTSAFMTAMAFYFPLIFILSIWKPRPSARLTYRESLFPAIAAGLRYVSMSPILTASLLRIGVFGLGATAIAAYMPLIAKDFLQGGAEIYGYLLGAFGIGGVIAALIQSGVRRHFSSGTIVTGAFLVYGFTSLCVAYVHVLPITLIAMLLSGGSWLFVISMLNAIIQWSTPRWVVGRALSLFVSVMFATTALGSWLWGVVAERWDLQTALTLSAAILLLGTLLGLRFRIPHAGDLDLAPARTWRPPETKLKVAPDDGPVEVTIDYEIDDANRGDFLALMKERKAGRRRNGARKWSVMQDLSDPKRWTERYKFPNWQEYVLHNERMTQADAHIARRILQLHQGAEKPKVTRRIDQSIHINSPADSADDLGDVTSNLT